MDHTEQSKAAIVEQGVIPAWLKLSVLAAAVGCALAILRAYSSSATQVLGIPDSLIFGFGLPLLILLIATTVWFLFVPSNPYALTAYWMLRFMREQIIVLSLLGLLYLLVLRIPILSLRGGLVWGTLLGAFVVSLILKPASLQDMPYYGVLQKWSADTRLRDAARRVPVWIPQAMVALLPVVLVFLMVYLVFGSRLSHYGPYSLFNDEVSYWVWLRSYHAVGFQSGYNVPNELLPYFEFSRYGEESPIYLYIYGFLTGWAPWFPALPILVNVALLPVAIFLALRGLYLTLGQTIMAGLAISLTWPVLFYLPMTTQETLNQVIGLMLAVLVAKLLLDRDRLSPMSRFGILLFVFLATLVRLSWGLMLVPVLFYVLDGKLAWRGMVALFAGAGLLIFAVIFTNYFTPPINDTIRQSLRDSGQNGLGIFIWKIYEQFYALFKPRQVTPSLGILLQMAIAAAWAIAELLYSFRSRKSALHDALHSFAIFDVYNMLSLVMAGLLFYAYKNFFRAFVPSMLLLYLLQVKRRDYKHLVALLLINLLVFPSYLTYLGDGSSYGLVKADYTSAIPQRAILQAEIEKFVVYDPEAANLWCNTLLIPLHFYDSRLSLIPAGIGISYLMDGPFQPPIKSRYALFDLSTYEAYKDSTHLKLLTSLPIGDLYANQDAGCAFAR